MKRIAKLFRPFESRDLYCMAACLMCGVGVMLAGWGIDQGESAMKSKLSNMALVAAFYFVALFYFGLRGIFVGDRIVNGKLQLRWYIKLFQAQPRRFDRQDVIAMAGGLTVLLFVMAAGWIGWLP